MANHQNALYEEYDSNNINQLLDSIQSKITQMIRNKGSDQLVLIEQGGGITVKFRQRLSVEEKTLLSKELQGSLLDEGNQAIHRDDSNSQSRA